jgi:hypothetical protein
MLVRPGEGTVTFINLIAAFANRSGFDRNLQGSGPTPPHAQAMGIRG